MKNLLKVICLSFMLYAEISCKSGNVADMGGLSCLDRQYCIADVMADEALDTIVLTTHPAKRNHRLVSIIKNGEHQKICEVSLRNDNVAALYLEANDPNSDEKGIRLVERRANFIPDYKYIDIYFARGWKTIRAGKINTNPSAELLSCVATLEGNLADFAKRDEENNKTIIDIDGITIDYVSLDSWDCD